MKIRCSRCGESVSNMPESETLVVQAWVECPACLARYVNFEVDELMDELESARAGEAAALERVAELQCNLERFVDNVKREPSDRTSLHLTVWEADKVLSMLREIGVIP